MPATKSLIRNILPAIILFAGLLFNSYNAYAQRRDSLFNIRILDVIGDRHLLLKGFPDTLVIGAFTLVVEEYDPRGSWNAITKTYSHLNGIGRIKFSCQPRIIFPGPLVLWKDAVMKPFQVTVVDTVRIADQQISVRDAAQLGLRAQAGSNVQLMLPHYADKPIALSRYLNDMVVKRSPPEGIRVRFTDLDVKVSQAGANKGLVIAGTAHYPSQPPVPDSPFVLNIHSGFKLQVSELTIVPNRDAVAMAKLILPGSLSGNEDCTGAILNLGDIAISQRCEFYKELPDSSFGIFGVGVTGLAIQGKGYVVDFSSIRRYIPSGKVLPWKGVILIKGASKGSPTDSVVSNIGYMQAEYAFTNGIVESNGLHATFNNSAPYQYTSAQPLGYFISFATAVVSVSASQVSDGNIHTGKIELPRTAVRKANDATVVLTNISLRIFPNMDLYGDGVLLPGTGLYWGDLIAAGGGERKSFGVEDIDRGVHIYFSAIPRPEFLPVTASGKKFNLVMQSPTRAILEAYGIQGATFTGFGKMLVNSPDVSTTWRPNDPVIPWANSPVRFQLIQARTAWLNVVTEGVHCSIISEIKESPGLELGNVSAPLYVGKKTFKTKTSSFDKNKNHFSSIILQCVESAVINCDFRSFIDLPAPTATVMGFNEMVFTSTANNAGGKVEIGNDDSLAYWGLKLEPRPGFSSAGLVSVKTGQIVLTAAGLSEKRHFAQPFWINWGEILASGELARLFFDNNSAGQQFDGFNFVHTAVALSPFTTGSGKPFLRVGGTAHFPFFGGDYLHIKDIYDVTKNVTPYDKRVVELSNEIPAGFLPSDLDVEGNWSDGLGIFKFKLAYADAAQDGFVGTGTSNLRYLLGGNIGSFLEMNSRGTCIRIGSDLNDQRALALGPVANISNITRMWGCACIKNDGIENLVVGGEVTHAANVSIAARAGSFLSMVMQVTPALAKLTLDGEAYLSLALSLDAVVNGHMQLIFNHAQGFLEGEVAGKMRTAQGSLNVFAGNSLEAEGQANWHLGVDFQELQGMVSLRVMNFGGGTDLGAAFYIAKNAPKSRAWVLIGNDPRYNLNMAALPNRLSGIYGAVHIQRGVNLFVVSGGYDVFVGLGAFMLTPEIAAQFGGILPGPGLPYVLGNLGGGIHGEILGGLVSASAHFNLQLMGPYPFSFEGTVGLEGCVVWVACHSVDITVGLNTTEGFYIK